MSLLIRNRGAGATKVTGIESACTHYTWSNSSFSVYRSLKTGQRRPMVPSQGKFTPLEFIS
eukprot:snap_masked-scaffold_2-processed-gene-24.23-mRNA-1 protein AED:1.00 eAED:1.00 QI:0/0/0/0/1/1/2/0/60